MKLRDYQKKAADKAILAIKNGVRRPVICSATGTGKSLIIASLIDRILNANPSVNIMVAAHVAELLRQNAGKLTSIRPMADVAFYSAELGKKDFGQITFAGIQSVFRAIPDRPYQVLIVDEVHTISRKDQSMWHKFIGKLKELYPNLIIIGLSATPFRMDSGSLTSGDDAMFDEIVFDYGLKHAVQDGYLCRLVGKGTKTKYDISGVGKLAGEFNLKQLQEATNLDHLTHEAVKESIIFGQERKSWLAFCNGVEHSFAIRDAMRAYGISCETVTGETPPDERDRILRGFKAGDIRCVTNNAVWTTGVDIPNVDMILMFRHTMSSNLLLQMAGRGTRVMLDLSPYETAKDRLEAIAQSIKPDCLFVDFAGNIERHGFLDEITAKDKKKKGDGVAPMKSCPDCFSILHAAARKCSDCGFEFPENKQQLLGSAYTGQVMSSGTSVRKVIDIIYTPHNMNREGKTPCMRVQYCHPDNVYTYEYILLQHEGWAKERALKWWKDRGGASYLGDKENIISNIFKHNMTQKLKVSSTLTVVPDGKFEKIVKHGVLVDYSDIMKQDEPPYIIEDGDYFA